MEMIEYLSASSILDYIFRELLFLIKIEKILAHTPAIGNNDNIIR